MRTILTMESAKEILGHGIYDFAETARLLRVSPEVIARWSRPKRTRSGVLPPIVEPTVLGGTHFSFHDLISLLVVSELWHRDIYSEDIRAGVAALAKLLDTPRPLAHREIATAGRDWYANLSADGGSPDWVAPAHGGQGTLFEVIEPFLRPIEYGPDDMASIWRPHTRVWLNPLVQAGASCVDARRVETQLITGMLQAGDTAESIAWAYDLAVDDVLAAEDFERSLNERAAAA